MSVTLADLGFGLCGLGFIALAVILRPGAVAPGMPRLRLRVAALTTAVWAALMAALVRQGLLDPALSHLLSYVLVGIWVWQLAPFARTQGQPRAFVLALEMAGLVILLVALGWLLAAGRINGFPVPSLAMLATFGLALCAFGLFAVEQLYRSAGSDAQSAMRWLGLGIGGVFLAELMAFAETLLIGNPTPAPAALRGAVYALCALAMIRGARQMPQWALGVSVSRHVVFYASSFVFVGAYLVAMALAGWLLLRFAGGWHPAARAGFALLAALGLGLSLFSSSFFRRLKVFINTHFYPQRYDYRVEWMRFTRTLSADDQEAGVPQRSIRAVAQIVGSPRGSLWRREAEGSRYQCAVEWPASTTVTASMPAAAALPGYLQATGWLIDLRELAQRPDLYSGLSVEAAPLAAALEAPEDALIVPLLHVDQLYGWIVLARAPGKGELDFEDRDLLKVAGRHVAAHLAQLDADAQLTQAQQFETYNRMTAFVMHDLKNIAAQLRLVSQNAERHRSNPEFVDDAFRTVAAAAARMSKLIAQLATGRESGTLRTIDLASCAERAALHCSGGVPVPEVQIAARPTVFADAEHLATIIEHAIRNAQEATAANGEIRVEVDVRNHRPVLSVVDNGSGMDAQFVQERLFRPFDTTKGARGMGIGAFQIREYLRSLGGEVEVQSAPGQGTRITMAFPDRSVLTMGREAV